MAGALSCDVVEFEGLLDRGERAAAIELYRGTLLDAFYADGTSAELESWIDGERTRLARKAFSACSDLADEAERLGNGIAAAHWARRAVDLVPDNEVAVRRLIRVLDAFGDRAGALRVVDDFVRHLEREFGSCPAAETRALVEAVRSRDVARISETQGTQQPEETPFAKEMPTAAALENGLDATPAKRGTAQSVSPAIVARRSTTSLRRVALASLVVIPLTTAAVFGELHRGSAPPRPASRTSEDPERVVSRSAGARRLYREALGQYVTGNVRESARLLNAAIADDSTCAMCAYQASMADASFDHVAADRMLRLALRFQDRVCEAERMLIRYRWADSRNSPLRRILADSLASRFPEWPPAQTAAGEAAIMDANWLAAAEHLHRAVAAAAPGLVSRPACPACAAWTLLITAYTGADSLSAALHVARQLRQWQPHSRLAWLKLSHVLSQMGRYDEARAALDTSTRYASDTDDDLLEHASLEIRAGDFATADRLLRAVAQAGRPDKRVDALWFTVISLRAQGRVREALRVATGPLRQAESASGYGADSAAVAEAELRFELGEDSRAAAIFTKLGAARDSSEEWPKGGVARQRAWMLTHAGSALAAAGDTAALVALADTVEAWGARSALARDKRLHHYLRGLLWMARAQPESAMTAFRLATISETEGFSRLVLDRARALLAVGRPRDAIPMLQHALEGSLEGGNFYASRTELQEELARAYDAASMRDSAATYYAYVSRAWRDANPAVQAAGSTRARSTGQRRSRQVAAPSLRVAVFWSASRA